MNTLFLDLEWGQVYGSYRSHVVPREVGCIISSPGQAEQNFESKKFRYDVNLVIRRNTIDASAKTTGFSETVINPGRDEYQKVYDPSFRLKKEDKISMHRISRLATRELGSYISLLLQRYNINQLILFGGAKDLKLLQQGGTSLSKLEIIDVQHIIQEVTRFRFSLDKIAFIIGFTSDTKWFGANHVRYRIPSQYRYVVKPHRAIGDVCRIFTVYQEFHRDRDRFIQDCKQYLRLHERTKAKTAKTTNISTHESKPQDSIIECTTRTFDESVLIPEKTPLTQEAKLCPWCKKTDTIPYNDGVWCSNCGRFVVPPDPKHTAHISDRPPTFREPYYSNLWCSTCSQPLSYADGIYDDGEWISWNYINRYI